MPYTLEKMDSDSRFRGLPQNGKILFMKAFNAAFLEYRDEGKAFGTAWAAIKKQYRQVKPDKWIKRKSPVF